MLSPGTEVRWWLLWAAIPYALAARLRVWCYRSGLFSQRKLPVPVISVGNMTMGGTGKTPVVILLAEWLHAQGKRVAILSRGYRRSSTTSKLLVSDGTRVLVTAEEAGDEPFLMARRCPKAVVAVGTDRYTLGQWVLSRYSIDCVLLDDGFQHLSLHRNVNLLLIDATDGEGLRAVVPAGRLREPLQAAARATAIVVTRAERSSDVEQVRQRLHAAIGPIPEPIQIVFRAQELVSVTTSAQQPLSWAAGKAAILCSGIGHAMSFRRLAGSLGLRILDEVVYTDHHTYTQGEVDRLRERAAAVEAELIITTEKDAGKLEPLLQPADGWWAIRLAVEVTVGEEQLRRLVSAAATMGPVEARA